MGIQKPIEDLKRAFQFERDAAKSQVRVDPNGQERLGVYFPNSGLLTKDGKQMIVLETEVEGTARIIALGTAGALGEFIGTAEVIFSRKKS